MMRVGGQSGTAMRSTMSFAWAGGVGPARTPAATPPSRASSNPVFLIYSPPMLPAAGAAVGFFDRRTVAPVSADRHSRLPREHVRVGKRYLDLELVTHG